MNNRLCLHCLVPLAVEEGPCHVRCIKKFYNQNTLPLLPYALDELDRLAEIVVKSRVTIPGVQPKISLHIAAEKGQSRLTIVGLWGRYILKPPVGAYPAISTCSTDQFKIIS